MKQRVADFAADFFAQKGIRDVFSVVGGGSMFLNDAFGKHPALRCTYNHHEQASAMAAEAYARLSGVMALVCVTTGPGGTNALTGVLGGYQDSIPMFIISGQVRYPLTVESTGLKLRQFGTQEYQIVSSAAPMTKYAAMIRKPEEIRYELEKAYHIATTGRRGPVWIDIPLDIQGAVIETDGLAGFDAPAPEQEIGDAVSLIAGCIQKAERPVIISGSGIRNAGALEDFRTMIEKLRIPVVRPLVVADYFPNSHPLNFGALGSVGCRAANFIVKNADLLISIGARLSFAQIGFNFEGFAPEAKKIVVDIDPEELKKKTLRIDYPICADAAGLIRQLCAQDTLAYRNAGVWLDYCTELKERYPIYQEKFRHSKAVNPYYFVFEMNRRLTGQDIVVLGNSSGLDTKLQMGIETAGERVILNANTGAMGYDLPAGIGAARASDRPVYVFTGDGCIQMNLQEMQTIIHNRLPVKILIYNNNGYQGVVQTQTNFFDGRLCGCTADSGISMPDFRKIAEAYGFQYMKIENNAQVEDRLDALFAEKGCVVCEIMQDLEQQIEPRVVSRKTEEGNLLSTPIDDLYPFLSSGEYEQCQFSCWLKNRMKGRENVQ